MSRHRVAIVTCDPGVRMAAAKAFDGAPREWSVRLCETPPVGADVVVLGPDAPPEERGIRFDPEDPARLLSDVERSLRREGGVVAVTGACGGAGTTTIALHLGYALKSCVVDLSPHGGVARRLAIDEPRVFEEGADVLGASLPVAPGVRILMAPNFPDAVPAASKAFGGVVVDYSGAPLPGDVKARILILPPSLPAARRARDLLTEATAEVCAVVVNRLGPGGNATRRALEQQLGRRISLMLPCAPGLRDAEDDGRLLTSINARWWRKLGPLAAALRRL